MIEYLTLKNLIIAVGIVLVLFVLLVVWSASALSSRTSQQEEEALLRAAREKYGCSACPGGDCGDCRGDCDTCGDCEACHKPPQA